MCVWCTLSETRLYDTGAQLLAPALSDMSMLQTLNLAREYRITIEWELRTKQTSEMNVDLVVVVGVIECEL